MRYKLTTLVLPTKQLSDFSAKGADIVGEFLSKKQRFHKSESEALWGAFALNLGRDMFSGVQCHPAVFADSQSAAAAGVIDVLGPRATEVQVLALWAVFDEDNAKVQLFLNRAGARVVLDRAGVRRSKLTLSACLVVVPTPGPVVGRRVDAKTKDLGPLVETRAPAALPPSFVKDMKKLLRLTASASKPAALGRVKAKVSGWLTHPEVRLALTRAALDVSI